MSLFEQATRNKYRYATNRGLVTTEDLWDLSLQELDQTAVGLNRQIKATQEESFLAENKTDESLIGRLEVLKAVITYKQEQEENRKQEAVKRTERAKLLELLDAKKDEHLATLSVEEIQKKLAAL